MKELKFEIKPLEQKPKEKELEPRPEKIETWEDEGGTTEGSEEEPQEVFDKIE